MDTTARIAELYASTLKPRLEALEALRLSLKGYIVKGLLCIGVPFALFFFSDVVTGGLSGGAAMLVNVGAFALIFVGVVFAGFKFLIPGITAYANYKIRFKREVATEIFTIVCPSATYAPLEGLAQADFDEPGLFNTRGGFRSDDRLYGTIGQTAFEAAEVRRSYSTGGKNSKTIVVFHGLFFHLDFNKSLRGVTIVQPEDARATQLGSRDGLTQVALENPAFESAFAVYASDEVEARYILTPAMMEQILALRERAGKPVFLAFKNNRAYLGVHYGGELFEPGIASTTSLESIQEMAAHFALAEGIVSELDLNTRIWTKGVDDSLLKRVATAPDDAFSALMTRGDITDTDLWTAANKAIAREQGSVDAHGQEVEVAAPPSTSIQIERSAGTTAIHYGMSIGFFVGLALWLGAVAFGLAAARLMPAAAGMAEYAWLTAWIPVIPYASDVVAGYPIPWFIGSWVLYGITFAMWATRVRRVEVAPDAVRVWRGLRPVPRVYPRPEYGTVIKMENAVFVGKTAGLNLINPTASPMLTAEEAPWIASELRRAFRNSPPLR